MIVMSPSPHFWIDPISTPPTRHAHSADLSCNLRSCRRAFAQKLSQNYPWIRVFLRHHQSFVIKMKLFISSIVYYLF
uniref:Uncharacterized protein n=1 Tax=Oryza brachyantha TaxID=4533 RepID=J3LBL7_ORYBR